MTKHTPTPWRVSKQIKGLITTKVRVALCDFNNGQSPDQIQATAEFIVRACNAHEDLLEACKLIDKHGTYLLSEKIGTGGLIDAVKIARLAVAKAEGGVK